MQVALALKTSAQQADGFDDPQAGVNGPARRILVRLWEAEVDEQAVAEILGDVTAKAIDDGAGRLLVLADDVTQFLRIEPVGERG